MTRKQTGFTIVELLIVIVVIAILAATTVVAYRGIQNRTYDSAIQSDLKNLATKLELYKVDTTGYPDASSTAASLNSIQFKATKSAYNTDVFNLIYCYGSDNNSFYKVIAKSKSGKVYYISHQNSISVEYTGSLPEDGIALCNSLLATASTTSYTYAGYNPTDTTTGPWRTWAGRN